MPKVEKGFLKQSLIKSECNGSFRGAEAGLALVADSPSATAGLERRGA